MKRFNLSGLIALGGAKGIGKTRFLLKLANSIANNEKVLFLSWQDCEENLSNILHSIDGSIHPNFDINTSLNYLNVGTFLEILKIIQKGKYTTIFVDDIENFTQNDYQDFFCDEKDNAIEALKYIANLINTTIVFATTIGSEEDISISKFNWSRRIINDCDQIIAISRPSHFGYIEDAEGVSLLDNIEISFLKNNLQSFTLNNKELNIYNNERNSI
ncbi:hypothetical protein ACXR6G_11525 [Ancylomarina sp. YFZ004]